jgi:hypothetical protein
MFQGKINRSRHSPQAYFIIKTIHLMNFRNADTVARIVKIGCSETNQERRELCAFSSTLILKVQESSLQNNFGPLSSQQVRRKRQDAACNSVFCVIQTA